MSPVWSLVALSVPPLVVMDPTVTDESVGATWHTVSNVFVQAVLTPAKHEATVAQVLHGATPEAENVVPAAHAGWHTVSDVAVQAVLTPAEHEEQVLHGPFPDAENVVLAAHAPYLQQLALLGVVAVDLVASYTRVSTVESHEASANAAPPYAVFPHVGTNAATAAAQAFPSGVAYALSQPVSH